MIRNALLALLPILSACSLVHQDSPNEAPVVEMARFVCIGAFGQRDTLSMGETCLIRRGGEVELSAFATDEDDDPLFYHWTSFGAGSFRDSLAAQTSWFAPQTLESNSEIFLIQASISDRDCSAVALEEDRQTCLSDASTQLVSFLVNVVQRPPVLSAIGDTTVFFNTPQVTIDALASDLDGDALTYEWQQLDDHPALTISNTPITDEEGDKPLGARGSFTPLFPGQYQLRITVSDGDLVAEQDVSVNVVLDEEPPDGGMVRLELPLLDGTIYSYEMDVYEYPNRRGEQPQQATWFEAAVLCAAEGKRLCDPTEWEFTCKGSQQKAYSSLDDPADLDQLVNFGLRFCNTERSYHSTLDANNNFENEIADSGSYPNCHSGNGVYDLTGNLREWTGNLSVFGDWIARSSRSSLILDEPGVGATCESLELFAFSFLQGQDFDFSNAPSIQQFVDGISAFDRQSLEQPITGFRCCR